MIANDKSIPACSNALGHAGVRCITSVSWDYRTTKTMVTSETLAGHTHDLNDREKPSTLSKLG